MKSPLIILILFIVVVLGGMMLMGAGTKRFMDGKIFTGGPGNNDNPR